MKDKSTAGNLFFSFETTAESSESSTEVTPLGLSKMEPAGGGSGPKVKGPRMYSSPTPKGDTRQDSSTVSIDY